MNVARLRLSVQYASERPAPERAQIRRWVRAALVQLAANATTPHGRAIDGVALTIRFVDDDEGRVLNRDFRGKDYATNVLTFPYDDATAGRGGRQVEADVVVCMPVLEAEAEAQRKALPAHTAHLVVHGTLHACGYDHEDGADAETMEMLERAVLARFGIADPYRDDGDATHRGAR